MFIKPLYNDQQCLAAAVLVAEAEVMVNQEFFPNIRTLNLKREKEKEAEEEGGEALTKLQSGE